MATGVLAALAAALPGAASMLQFDRAAILGHAQWWRLFTGHFCHWDINHLIWDVAVFAVAGMLVARESKARFAACVFVTAGVSSALLLAARPELDVYRGLSGIDCALVMATAVTLFLRADSSVGQKAGALTLMLAGIAKVAFETLLDDTLFVRNANFLLVPSAHIVGLVIGGIAALVHAIPQRNHERLNPTFPVRGIKRRFLTIFD